MLKMKKLYALFTELGVRGAGGRSCDIRWSSRFPNCNTSNSLVNLRGHEEETIFNFQL